MICSEVSIDDKIIWSIVMAAIFILFPFFFMYSRFIKKKYGVFITKFNGKYSVSLHKEEFAQQSLVHKFFYSAAMAFALVGGVAGTLLLGQMFLCLFTVTI